MNELEEVWTQMMNQAIADARDSGRHDVAEYLTLKATNDFVRAASVKWLFDSMNEIAAQSRLAGIKIENENPHRFPFNKAHMVGSRLSLRQGVRCLSIEAGWTRTPADGFMRGGALAAGKITHFGMAAATEEIILLKNDDFPQWFSIDRQERKTIFDSNNLQKHFRIFTGS